MLPPSSPALPLDDARKQGKKVQPQCSYVDGFMRRNQEYESLRAGDEAQPVVACADHRPSLQCG